MTLDGLTGAPQAALAGRAVRVDSTERQLAVPFRATECARRAGRAPGAARRTSVQAQIADAPLEAVPIRGAVGALDAHTRRALQSAAAGVERVAAGPTGAFGRTDPPGETVEGATTEGRLRAAIVDTLHRARALSRFDTARGAGAADTRASRQAPGVVATGGVLFTQARVTVAAQGAGAAGHTARIDARAARADPPGQAPLGGDAIGAFDAGAGFTAQGPGAFGRIDTGGVACATPTQSAVEATSIVRTGGRFGAGPGRVTEQSAGASGLGTVGQADAAAAHAIRRAVQVPMTNRGFGAASVETGLRAGTHGIFDTGRKADLVTTHSTGEAVYVARARGRFIT